MAAYTHGGDQRQVAFPIRRQICVSVVLQSQFFPSRPSNLAMPFYAVVRIAHSRVVLVVYTERIYARLRCLIQTYLCIRRATETTSSV